MFEYYGHIHVYIPAVGADNPQRTFFSININPLSNCILQASPLPPFNNILLISSFKCMVNLCWPCHKIGQGQPKVMIYVNFVELFSLMLHAKFQNHRSSDSGELSFFFDL